MIRWKLVFAVCLVGGFTQIAQAQMGPTRARPIASARKNSGPPMMLIEQKPRRVVVDVTVGADGRVVTTRVIEPSGNGVYDERVRGYWKERQFVPALDASGVPRVDTLHTITSFAVNDTGSDSLKAFKGHAEIDGANSTDTTRINLMSCKDFLWEYDFMKTRAPKADHTHDDLFKVALGMFVLQSGANPTERDALIAEWAKLVDQTIAACREKPAAFYWKDVFVPIFTRAMPYSSPPVP